MLENRVEISEWVPRDRRVQRLIARKAGRSPLAAVPLSGAQRAPAGNLTTLLPDKTLYFNRQAGNTF